MVTKTVICNFILVIMKVGVVVLVDIDIIPNHVKSMCLLCFSYFDFIIIVTRITTMFLEESHVSYFF